MNSPLTYLVYETWSNRDAVRRELIASFLREKDAKSFTEAMNAKQLIGIFHVCSDKELSTYDPY